MAEKSYSQSYKDAGVDITAGYEAVARMNKHTKRTNVPGVLSPIGGFGGLFMPDLSGIRTPVLVSGTDGVGTKLKLAFFMDRHHTVGIDCVAMCVNDIICCGAKPLFFLDYIAVEQLLPERVEKIVSGIAEGCVQAGCALIGGETAEMPGFYPKGEYDLAGFCVGLADKEKLLDPANVREGDVILSLPSSGPHSNGFSLIRKLFAPDTYSRYSAELQTSIGDALLTPTRIYVEPILSLLEQIPVKAISHITGGGFFENIPRCLPEGLVARIDKKGLQIPPVFDMIQKQGDIPVRDMFNTFNMGTGMCAVVAPQHADTALYVLAQKGVAAYIMGEIVPGERGVELWD